MKALFRALPAIAAIIILCACAQNTTPAASAAEKDIETTDGRFVFSTPQDWSAFEGTKQQYQTLNIADSDGGHANIYFYGYDVGDITIDDFLQQNKDYYGSNIIGDVQSVEVNGLSGNYFEYSMADMGEDNKQYIFRGYEYLFAAADGIVEIDIYYSQTQLDSKLFKITDEELGTLRGIAQSIKVKQSTQSQG